MVGIGSREHVPELGPEPVRIVGAAPFVVKGCELRAQPDPLIAALQRVFRRVESAPVARGIL